MPRLNNSDSPSTSNLVVDPNGDKNFNDNIDLRAAISVHNFIEQVYDYYKTKHNRDSWNGLGGSLKSIVNAISTEYGFPNQASWTSGHYMKYGPGDGIKFSNLEGSLDVTAHEITHGVTESTADLTYYKQSGALDESYSDVFACMIDDNDWLVGEDVTLLSNALRSLQSPSLYGQPDNFHDYKIKADDDDYGGVHTNSGIPNKVAYIVASKIGREKTAKIYYLTLTTKLTSNSQFIDAANLTLQSANELYGSNSTEYNAVKSGFQQVEILASYPPILATPSNSSSAISLSPTLNWNLSEGSRTYHLQVSLESIFNTLVFEQNDLSITSKQVNNLLPGKTYYWRVRAINAGGISNWSNIWSFNTINSLTISGTIKNESLFPINGAKVTFSNNGGTATTNSSGEYSIEVTYGWSGTATPSYLTDWTFNPTVKNYSNLVSNQTNQNYIAYPPPNPFIEGYVRDSYNNPISDVTITFSNSGGNTTTNSSGYYQKYVLYGWSGTATPSLSGWTFSPKNIPYNNVTSNQSIKNYTGSVLDITAPSAPTNLSSNPSSWTYFNTFYIDWTNPIDPSGIVAYWYKLGNTPTSNSDGVRTTNKPFTITNANQGGQSIYVWLEDGKGNKDFNNNSSVTLYYDGTAPTNGTITINDGASSTSSLIVTLNNLSVSDVGGSGLYQMQFSNNNNFWSDWENYGITKDNWDLSQFGGNTSSGNKIVFVQYKIWLEIFPVVLLMI